MASTTRLQAAAMKLVLLMPVFLLSGCVMAYKLDLSYSPQPDLISALAHKTFDVTVVDRRP